MKFKNTDVITIFGKRGSGKTRIGMHIITKYPKTFIFDTLGEFSKNEKFGKVVYNLSDVDVENDTKIVFNPEEYGCTTEVHDIVSKWVWDNFKNCMFLTDEMHMFQSRSLTPHFLRLITQGRHQGIGCMAITQRFALLNQTILTQSHHIFIFKLFGRDIEVAKGYFGRDIEDKIRNLAKYEFLYYNTDADDIVRMQPLKNID